MRTFHLIVLHIDGEINQTYSYVFWQNVLLPHQNSPNAPGSQACTPCPQSPFSISPISITQGLYHWGLQICLRNSFSFSHFLCVSLKRLFLDSEPQVLTLLPQLWCQGPRLGIASGPLLPLQALWLPQCSYLAAFTSPFRGSLQRQLIRSGLLLTHRKPAVTGLFMYS